MLAGVDAGTLLYSAMGQKDPTVDMFSSLLVEFQRSEAAAIRLQLVNILPALEE